MELLGRKAIDLFAGAGGFSLAASNLGLDILAAVEIDEDSCDTYKHNIIGRNCQNTKLLNEDILSIDPMGLMDDLNISEGQLDFLMGGPPCQGFSTHRIKNKGIDDPRNALLLRYFDFVKVFKPKVFLVENVPGLLWKRHELYLQKFKNLSLRNGYSLLGPEKVNAKDYGVPQNRERVFILGVRTDVDSSDIVWPPAQTHGPSEQGLQKYKNASTVFENAPKKVIGQLKKIVGSGIVNELEFGKKIPNASMDSSAIHMNHTDELIGRFKMTPVNGSRRDIDFRLPCHSNGYDGHLDVYGRIRLAQPGPTITTGCFNPSKGRFLHPWKNHGITIRHAARFQTFPDEFIFSGGITSQGKQVGNAVPVVLGEVMIKSALNFVIKGDNVEQATA